MNSGHAKLIAVLVLIVQAAVALSPVGGVVCLGACESRLPPVSKAESACPCCADHQETPEMPRRAPHAPDGCECCISIPDQSLPTWTVVFEHVRELSYVGVLTPRNSVVPSDLDPMVNARRGLPPDLPPPPLELIRSSRLII